VGSEEHFAAGPLLETPSEWQDMIQQVAGHAPVRAELQRSGRLGLRWVRPVVGD